MNRAKLKKALKNRETIFGGWISYDHPSIAETFALTGFDFISIDMEHAPISLASAQRIISISQSKEFHVYPDQFHIQMITLNPYLIQGLMD